jgi:hypothetical protein
MSEGVIKLTKAESESTTKTNRLRLLLVHQSHYPLESLLWVMTTGHFEINDAS